MFHLRTHKERINSYKGMVENDTIPAAGIFNRSAVVKFLLLEDILKDYQERLKKAQKDLNSSSTPVAQRVNQSNVRIFEAIIKAFDALIQVTQGLIGQGKYSDVKKAIPEYKLSSLARSPQKFGKLAELAATILKRIGKDAAVYAYKSKVIDDAVDDFDINEANSNKVYDIPSSIDINSIIAEIDEINKLTDSINQKPKSNLK